MLAKHAYQKSLRENARKCVLDQIVAVKKYIDTLSIVKTHTARIIKSSLEASKLQRAKKKYQSRITYALLK